MDSNSWNKALDLIFNILPRTVAPLRAISYSVKKNKEKIWQNFFFQNYFKKSFREIATFTSRLPPRFLSNVMNLSATLHKRIKKTESERKFWELTVCCSQKLGEDFEKILWPSQNIWTLPIDSDDASFNSICSDTVW